MWGSLQPQGRRVRLAVASVESPTPVKGLKIVVKFFTTLREITEKREEELTLPEITTVGEALDELARKYGARFIDYVFEKGQIRPYLQILLNGRNINLLQGLETRLEAGATLALLPPAGGGSKKGA